MMSGRGRGNAGRPIGPRTAVTVRTAHRRESGRVQELSRALDVHQRGTEAGSSYVSGRETRSRPSWEAAFPLTAVNN